jgi:hypothetical protein
MAVSEAQLAANRANALKSTGPKDTSKTKFNGIRHSLTATHALLPWEHKEDLDTVIQAYDDRFQPVDQFERLTIKYAAEAYWRRERSLRVEANIFETVANAEYQKTKSEAGDLHAGNLEAIAFMKAKDELAHYRRYDAHLQRAYERAMREVEKMASLRKQKEQPPLPPAEPEPRREGAFLRPAVAHVPMGKGSPEVVGTRLTRKTPALQAAS